MRKPSSDLKMASAQVVETSVANNSPSQDSNHPDDLFQSRNNISIIIHFVAFKRDATRVYGVSLRPKTVQVCYTEYSSHQFYFSTIWYLYLNTLSLSNRMNLVLFRYRVKWHIFLK